MSGATATFIFILTALSIICATVLMIMHMSTGGGPKKRKETEAEEARLIQEMYESLGRLDRRVESLETILLEQERRERSVR